MGTGLSGRRLLIICQKGKIAVAGCLHEHPRQQTAIGQSKDSGGGEGGDPLPQAAVFAACQEDHWCRILIDAGVQ